MRFATFGRHTCPGKCQKSADSSVSCTLPKSDRPTNRALVVQSQAISGRIVPDAAPQMISEVFTSMLNDDVGKLARADSLIVKLGESWLNRSRDNEVNRKYYSSQHMRLMTRLLIEMRSRLNQADITLEACLTPDKFDDVVESVIATAAPYMDDVEQLRSPSNAIRFKYDLITCLEIKWETLAKKRMEETRDAKDCETFLKLIKSKRWAEKVTRLARYVLVSKKFNKIVNVPAPSDIVILTKKVKELLRTLDLTNPSLEKWLHVVRVVQARLLTFNKRRAGEINVIR